MKLSQVKTVSKLLFVLVTLIVSSLSAKSNLRGIINFFQN